jgi:hypothetical protein
MTQALRDPPSSGPRARANNDELDGMSNPVTRRPVGKEGNGLLYVTYFDAVVGVHPPPALHILRECRSPSCESKDDDRQVDAGAHSSDFV